MTLIEVSPSDLLVFNKTGGSVAESSLTLTNKSAGTVAFKVKTTAPDSYIVRPSLGTLARGDETEVKIVLQKQAKANDTNPDRFLVQAVVVGEGKVVTRQDWPGIPKESLQEKKLEVMIVGPPDP